MLVSLCMLCVAMCRLLCIHWCESVCVLKSWHETKIMFIKKLGQFKNNHNNTPVYDPTRVACFSGAPFIVVVVFRNVLNAGSTHFKNIHSSMGAQSCNIPRFVYCCQFTSTSTVTQHVRLPLCTIAR